MRDSRLVLASMMGLIGASALADAQKLASAGKGQRGLRHDAKYVHAGSTYIAGRNKEKKLARRDQARKRAYAVWVHAEHGFKNRAPKVKSSVLVIDMLANRRLRQRLAA